MNYLRKKFATVDEAEDAFGITLDSYLSSSPATESSPSNPEQGPLQLPEKVVEIIEKLTGVQRAMLATHILEKLSSLHLESTLKKVLPKVLPCLSQMSILELLSALCQIASCEALLKVADSVFCSLASKAGISGTMSGFVDTACKAMCELEAQNKPNVVYFLCRIIAEKREDGITPIIPLDRMPFGLIQYQLEFFNSTHICQVTILFIIIS